jgi:hypothetical protein
MLRKVLAVVAVAGLFGSLSAFAADAPKPAADAKKVEYVGSGKCKMCHSKEYKAWAETKHAHAFETLKKATPEQIKKMNDLLKASVTSPATDDNCVKCHVTGFGVKPSGYPNADSTKNAILASVSCEDCHGPGSAHMAVPMSDKEGRKASIKAPTAETCTDCHTKAISPDFKFEERAKLVHAVAAAAPPAK